MAWRSAPLNVQTWANRGSSARWAAARGSLRSSRRALTRWAIGSRARPSSAVHSCSGFRAGHCTKRTRQAESEALLVNERTAIHLIDPAKFPKFLSPKKLRQSENEQGAAAAGLGSCCRPPRPRRARRRRACGVGTRRSWRGSRARRTCSISWSTSTVMPGAAEWRLLGYRGHPRDAAHLPPRAGTTADRVG